jgi:hypothetical protein
MKTCTFVKGLRCEFATAGGACELPSCSKTKDAKTNPVVLKNPDYGNCNRCLYWNESLLFSLCLECRRRIHDDGMQDGTKPDNHRPDGRTRG